MSDNSIGLSAQEMEARFDLLATDAKEYAVFLVGLDGHLLCWNAGAERLFGFGSDEVIGQHFSRFFSPEGIRAGEPEHELKLALAAVVQTMFAGRFGRTVPDFGVRQS